MEGIPGGGGGMGSVGGIQSSPRCLYTPGDHLGPLGIKGYLLESQQKNTRVQFLTSWLKVVSFAVSFS